MMKDEFLNFIKDKREQKDYNDFIQCIWFCVSGTRIYPDEIEILKELKNNNHHIPLIVIYTRAINQEEINIIQNYFKTVFNNIKFIPILARGMVFGEFILESYRLDDLLNMTVESIKFNDKSDLLYSIKDEFSFYEKNKLNDNILKIKLNIINKFVEEFINNYTKVLSSEDFEQYVI